MRRLPGHSLAIRSQTKPVKVNAELSLSLSETGAEVCRTDRFGSAWPSELRPMRSFFLPDGFGGTCALSSSQRAQVSAHSAVC